MNFNFRPKRRKKIMTIIRIVRVKGKCLNWWILTVYNTRILQIKGIINTIKKYSFSAEKS